MATTTYVLHNEWALGDTVCLSALARDVRLAHPDVSLLMSGHYVSFWDNNPHCGRVQGEPRGVLLKPQYKEGIKEAGRGSKIHFLSWFHRDFERQTGLRVPVTAPKGDIHLSADERRDPFPGFRYWVVVAGGKLDMTAKVWDVARWQEAVDALRRAGVRCVQAGAEFHKHFQPRLQNVEQHVGKTDAIRELFRLIYNAEGVVCGVTAAMHIAAVFDKPCVVIAGGREEPWWEAYTNAYPGSFGDAPPVKVEHTFLHTVGLLDCGMGNLSRGCWRSRTVPIEKADYTNRKNIDKLCTRPLRLAHQAVPECMNLITAEHVVEAVMNYYEKGVIPPVGKPKGTYRHLLDATLVNRQTMQDVREAWGPLPAHPGPPPQTLPIPNHLGPPPTLIKLPYDLVDDAGNKVGAMTAEGPKYDLRNGVVTDHRVDHSTCPPTEHVQVMYENVAQAAKAVPAELKPPAQEPPQMAVLDHPFVGGKFTVCVLCYGDHAELAKRCIGSILDNSPAHRVDLRVALNQPSKRTLDYVMGFDKGVLTQVYLDRGTRMKYPAMREMFWDDCCPITTPYVLWFDDDSHVVDKDWLPLLGRAIVDNHAQGCRLYGTKYVHDLTQYRRQGYEPQRWFQEASWWQGRWMHMAHGQRLAPNGSQIVFATGGFWALATEVIRLANIPDPRLVHNGGDITIGEQVHQAGFKVFDFARGKKPVCWSDAPPRGGSHPGGPGKEFPWSKLK